MELDTNSQKSSQKLIQSSAFDLKALSFFNNILQKFEEFDPNEKNIIELLIALNIDACVNKLNIFNFSNMVSILLFAKTHAIDFNENYILSFYFTNLNILFNENEKIYFDLFFQIMLDNLLLIDEERLIILFNFYDTQSFEIKNELIFIFSDLYLINKIIFSEDQIEILLQQIFIFCIHSQ